MAVVKTRPMAYVMRTTGSSYITVLVFKVVNLYKIRWVNKPGFKLTKYSSDSLGEAFNWLVFAGMQSHLSGL